MRLNPEFQRNLWLEMTVHRLIAMPLILLLVFGLIYSGSGMYAWQPVAARTSPDTPLRSRRPFALDGAYWSVYPWASV